MKHRTSWAAALLALSLGAGRLAAAEPPAEPASLLGAWKLDPERSDDGRAKLAAARERGGEGRSGRPGGYGGPGGHRPMGGRPPGQGAPAQREALHQAFEDALEGTPLLTISSDQDELVLTSEDGSIRRLRPDGRKSKGPDGGLERKVEWRGASLVVETSAGDFATLTETFSREAAQLLVSVRVEGRTQREPLLVRRVYAPVLTD